jgi:hypothetical protein
MDISRIHCRIRHAEKHGLLQYFHQKRASMITLVIKLKEQGLQMSTRV